MSRSDKIVDKLTNQLCTHEKVLSNKIVESTTQEVIDTI